MKYFVTVGDRTVEVDLGGHAPVIDGTPVEAQMTLLPGTSLRSLVVDGRSHTLSARPGDRRGRWQVSLGGERFTVDAVDGRTRAIREMTGAEDDVADKTVLAPMPGLVLKVEVEVGQAVKAGQGLVIVEAMKMENELIAPRAGTVRKVHVAPGSTVEGGARLVEIG